jgi:2-iminobutanoate/2-iminopropanoate deaminase
VCLAGAVAAVASAAVAQKSPNGVRTPSPPGAVKPTGSWDVAARAGDFIYVAGMWGIDPKTDALVQGDEARTRRAFLNMKLTAESEGATLRDCVRIVVYTTDMYRFRPIANKVREKLWGKGPYPPRTIEEVHGLNQDDIWRLREPSTLRPKSDWLPLFGYQTAQEVGGWWRSLWTRCRNAGQDFSLTTEKQKIENRHLLAQRRRFLRAQLQGNEVRVRHSGSSRL